MKPIFLFLFLFGVFLISIVGAVSFSPSYLVFNLDQNQQECQTITLGSDSSTITVLDKWANESVKDWNVNLFNDSADEYKLSIDYPKRLSFNEKTVKVCLMGVKAGEYHGIVLLREEQKGNSVVQMGVWIKAVISNEKVASKSGSSNITGAVIGALEGSWKIFGVLILLIVIWMIVYIRNKRKNKWY